MKAILAVSFACCALGAAAMDWFIDSAAGNDASAGTNADTAWKTLDAHNKSTVVAPGDRVLFKRGGLWRGTLVAKSGVPGKPVLYSSYGAGPKPIIQNSVDRSRESDWEELRPGLWATIKNTPKVLGSALPFDVGIFICNHGEKWGVKKWSPDALKEPLDYWDDRANERVLVRLDGNPAKLFKSIELALTSFIVDERGCHDVVYDGLAVRYGGSHGFGGGGTRNIVIRNCDIYWIGGGLQFWRVRPNGERYPVRFGNGIEFWGECHNNLVERNRLWQIYDAALTNQTKDNPRWETDVTWRDNVIWQAEYSFEYWNHDPRSATCNILFEHNTCVDAGYCWSHTQRPNPNGAHLMFYDNAAPTTNFVVRNNVFVRTVDRSTSMRNDWRSKPGSAEGLTIDHNLYYIPENTVYEYFVNGRERGTKPGIRLTSAKFGAGPAEFAKYQSEMGMDAGSIYGEPQFIDDARRDYRLKPGTLGAAQATDGGPLGARNMPGLDADQSAPGN